MTTSASAWDDDREEWNLLWSGKTQLEIRSPILFGVELDPTLGDLESATISQAPAEVVERLGASWLVGAEKPLCPICGGTTIDTPRLVAKLNLSFRCGLQYGQGVWAHIACFESCSDTGVPAPIPW